MPSDAPALQHLSNDQRLELLLDAVTDYAIYMLDPDGFVSTWNTGAEKIKGYREAEIIGQHYSRFFTSEDRAVGLPLKILSAARTSGRHEAEGRRVRKDGTRFRCNSILQRVLDEKGALVGFANITRDITDRLAAQEAVVDSERRFRILVDGVFDYALYLLDPSGIIVNWNAGGQRLKGYTAEEIIGQHFSKFYTDEDRAAGVPGRVLEIARREGRFEAEGWRLRKDGSRFWASVVVDAIFNPSGQLEGFAKITRDITERRASQKALQESERQFRLLVSNVTDYGLFMLDPNGIVTSWNEGAQRIKGYTAEDIIGQHFSRFYTEQDRAAGLPARALYTAMHEGRFEAEGWRLRKDGSLFWANVVIDRIRDENGQLVGFAKITRDITERRRAQLALEEAEAKRAQSQKMDALGQLTGGVAHDFNNLLTIVIGQVEMIKKQVGDDPKVARSAEMIGVAVQRGASLTRQLLSFSRRQPANPTAVSLGPQIETFRTMLASTIGSTITLSTDILPDAWSVKVDASELELALVNLVLNARDALPRGGSIEITSKNLRLRREDTPAHIEGEFVALRVSDTGSGIAPDILAKVFDPFFTTKEVGKGTGLGLSQVYGFAHQSGGTVTIDSELGTGTTVTLYLPRATDDAPLVAKESEIRTSGDGKILWVEDNPNVAEASASMVQQLGYQVEVVHDAAAALEVVGREDFDLLVSDIVMAGDMDGVDLARAIRKQRPSLPILLVTGYSHREPEASEFPTMRKPYELAELSRMATRLMAEAKQPPDANVVRLPATRSPFQKRWE
jgi:PAS domain S-box-containing protein